MVQLADAGGSAACTRPSLFGTLSCEGELRFFEWELFCFGVGGAKSEDFFMTFLEVLEPSLLFRERSWDRFVSSVDVSSL